MQRSCLKVADGSWAERLDDPACTVQDHAYIYVVSEPYFGGDLMTCAQKASENGVALNQHWLAGILRQVCAPLA